jgi:hypothetical protein
VKRKKYTKRSVKKSHLLYSATGTIFYNKADTTFCIQFTTLSCENSVHVNSSHAGIRRSFNSQFSFITVETDTNAGCTGN